MQRGPSAGTGRPHPPPAPQLLPRWPHTAVLRPACRPDGTYYYRPSTLWAARQQAYADLALPDPLCPTAASVEKSGPAERCSPGKPGKGSAWEARGNRGNRAPGPHLPILKLQGQPSPSQGLIWTLNQKQSEESKRVWDGAG